MRAFGLIMLVFGFLPGTKSLSQELQGDKEKIQGTWKIVSFKQVEGRDMLPAEVLKAAKVVITADKMVHELGKGGFEINYKIDEGVR
jgi:hypothetical protein